MRILIADDDHMTRQLLEIALQGHNIIMAADGMEAVEMAQSHRPDVILMDIRMPKLSGFDALERIKADEATADIPVVLMSAAHIGRTDVERGLNLGAVEFMRKPLDVLGLARHLRYHMMNAYLRQARTKKSLDSDQAPELQSTTKKGAFDVGTNCTTE